MTEGSEKQLWTPTKQQRDRALRSISVLRRYGAPILENPVLYTDDDEEATIRDGAEVARRAMVLWAVALRGEGMPREEALDLIDKANLWSTASPVEAEFLRDVDPDPEVCQKMVWRLESIWVLMWALGRIEKLPWPSDMCNAAPSRQNTQAS